MNREVNLTKRVKTFQGLRYCPVVLSANGRVRPDWVFVDGKEERHPEGAYYLEWREGAKRTRLSVGKDPATATARRMQKEAELNAKNHGVEVVPFVPQNGNNTGNGHRPLATAIVEFLEETKLTKKPKTLAAYTKSLEYFAESCQKQYLDDIERRDLLRFAAFLRDEKEQAPRSCWNKFSNVMSFLKVNGIRGLAKKTDWPRYTEEEPEIYEQEEIDALFEACDSEERLWFEFFLMTGMREQEVMYTYWSDINLKHATVRGSPQTGSRVDSESLQRTRNPHSLESGREPHGMEEQIQEGMRSRVSNGRLQSEIELPGRSKGNCRTCHARQGQLLAPQVSRDVCNSLFMGRRGSSYGPAVAGAFRHGEHDAVSKTSTERGCARKGQSDFRRKEWTVRTWAKEAGIS